MFLSNRCLSLLTACFLALILQACGSPPANQNDPGAPISESKSRFPFSTTEPDVYQGDFVVSIVSGDGSNNSENHWFIARNGAKWRFDRYRSGPWRTEMWNDKLIEIDHERKLYTVKPAAAGAPCITSADVDCMGQITSNFFAGAEYREFEDLGIDGGLRKYRVREADPAKGEIYIYIDPASGLIVKQEFNTGKDNGKAKTGFVYEIRNLKLEVDDSIFSIPAGYRKVTAEEFNR